MVKQPPKLLKMQGQLVDADDVVVPAWARHGLKGAAICDTSRTSTAPPLLLVDVVTLFIAVLWVPLKLL